MRIEASLQSRMEARTAQTDGSAASVSRSLRDLRLQSRSGFSQSAPIRRPDLESRQIVESRGTACATARAHYRVGARPAAAGGSKTRLMRQLARRGHFMRSWSPAKGMEAPRVQFAVRVFAQCQMILSTAQISSRARSGTR